MTACTAVVTEISYHKADRFEAEIDFLSPEEWRLEVTTLVEDLRDSSDAEQGYALERATSTGGRDNPAAIARAKVRAAYPDTTVDVLVGLNVDSILKQSPHGKLDLKVFTFIATKCDDISSAEIVRGLGLQSNTQYQWIMEDQKQHKDEVKKWKGHEESANNATSDIQKSLQDAETKLSEYKRAVQSAPIKRKVPHTLEGDMDNHSKRPKVESTLGGAELMNTKEEPMGPLDESPALPALDRISDLVPPQDIEQHRTRISELQQSCNTLIRQSKEARFNVSEAEKQWRNSCKEMTAFCSLQCSQYSMRRIQADFRTGLSKLGTRFFIYQCMIETNGKTPNSGIHTKDDLPVFTVSAWDHALLSGGAESACFTHIEQTCIPALREWCHTLTLPVREKATHNLLVQLRAFVQSFRAFVEGTPGVSEKDRSAMKKRWESSMVNCSPEDFKNRAYQEVKAKQRMTGDFTKVINNSSCDLQDTFEEYLGDKCDEGEVRLINGYRLAMQEKGPGSVKRQKTVVHDYVDSKKDTAFKGAAEVLTTGLHEAGVSVEEHLNNDFAKLSMTMERNMAVLWDGPVSGEDQIAAHLEILDLLHEISGHLGRLLAAKKQRDEGQAAGSA
ncbi:hypothetical protein C8T65DRAFT_825464 [Cerioporus squamosus]|nr:hypothetical protein C8T65DRAFT_825464 [Cerioporus squamosus]